ncbi:hypothetical protein K493DRAFT_311097 [Basidiobolus meristosporus CBS 931.73]|uniref:Uncharacterized protein n=1 Tax=Basidiobolus meristosporus CBS 931.73 TaxID=1314790 RepID=A0A1Y1Z551_9FUNG|nr:hypothetical protein K493DRAFT_311097 [Basidiobolus meristosporus CBS 931.73]|eukprot:ORY05107.1 hypothetical protein K493DRAFT_311097 [Basidiobolus meristosporus CBS 931.73]
MPSVTAPDNFAIQRPHTVYNSVGPYEDASPPTYSFPEPSIFPNYRRSTEPCHNPPFDMPSENSGSFASPFVQFPEPGLPSSFPPNGQFVSMPSISTPNTSLPYTPGGQAAFPMTEGFLTSNKYEAVPAKSSAMTLPETLGHTSNTLGIVPVTDDIYPPLFSGYPPTKPSQISALANITGAKISDRFEWVYATNGYIPPEAIGCGKESNDSPLYISKGVYKQVTHVGMVAPHLKGISFVHKNSVIKQKECYVLCGDIRGLRWVKCMGAFNMKGGRFVEAGTAENGKAICIGLVDYRGGIYIGEVGEHTGGMSFAYQGKKVMAPDFYYVLAYNF